MKELRQTVVEITLILALVWTSMQVAGCQTVKGFSKDVSGLAAYVDESIVDK